jgi:hypothetical protein
MQVSNFMEIRPVGAEFFHEGRQTDGKTDRHDELDSCFSQFWEKRLETWQTLR